LAELSRVNYIWAVLNLFPVLPLDGGRVAHTLLGRLFGAKGPLLAWGLSAVVAGVTTVLATQYGQSWLALFFGIFAVQAGASFLTLVRRQRAVPEPPLLAEARALFARGDWDEAQRRAQQVSLDAASPPAVRARAEHLLGWIALKEGKGREALDHFSQVSSGQRVEREALAAAFSLIGDDARALPLWELAQREHPGATLLHEWAGCLIRLGRVDDAKRLPGVVPALAFTCAERVLFLREEFAGAAEAGRGAFQSDPSAERAYDIACADARAGDWREALAWLEKARELGFSDAEKVRRDPDLVSLHGHPELEAFFERLKKS
jgi:tetratricopeptide (TPR) repeat protein